MTTSNTESEPDQLEQLARTYGIKYIPVVRECVPVAEMLDKLPVEWAREHAVLPVHYEGVASLLLSDPAAVEDQEYVSLLLGSELQPLLAPRKEIIAAIEHAYFRRDNSPADFIDDLAEGNEAEIGADRDVSDLLQVASGAPVTQLMNLILLDAYKQNASDIHVEPFERRLRVRYRIDGVLYEQSSPPYNMIQPLVSRLKVMAHMDIAERRLPQDGMARVRVGEREIDIRVSTVPVSEGERVVLRLLDKNNVLLSLSDLGMEADAAEDFRGLLKHPNGIIIVSGPTGSGKTTTLYAALGEIDSSRKNILTVEDPVEYQLDNIGQIQVKPKIGLTFSSGLRHILRQDPDVILVGETRDSETAEIAVRAALTGHLVFTTLHTNDAAGAVVRLIDMGIAPYLIASSLRGVLGQRLVRRLCPDCRILDNVAEPAGDVKKRIAGLLAGRQAWKAVGCNNCTDGYRGRVGIFEMLTISAQTRELIRASDFSLAQLRSVAVSDGFRSLVDDGVEKIARGITTVDEVLGAAEI